MQFPACVLEDISSCVFVLVFSLKKTKQNEKQHYLTICHPGSLSDALELAHSAARHFLTASHLQGAQPQTLHGSLEWMKGTSLYCRCLLGQRQLPLHVSLQPPS